MPYAVDPGPTTPAGARPVGGRLGRGGLLAGLVLAAWAGQAGAARAGAPVVEDLQVHDVQVLSGPDSPCGFPLTFTGDGAVRVSTYLAPDGTPVRSTVHDSLSHTLSSAWATLSSPGPAAVHTDLVTGTQSVTGLQYAFRVPQHGIVLGAAGRLVVGPDGAQLRFSGLDRLVAPVLCAALGP